MVTFKKQKLYLRLSVMSATLLSNGLAKATTTPQTKKIWQNVNYKIEVVVIWGGH